MNRVEFSHVRTESDLADARSRLDDLLSRPADEQVDAAIDVLSDLIEAYETEHLPFPGAPAGDVLAELMASNGVTAEALGAATGVAPADLAAILAGSRPPSPGEVSNLAAFFNASPAAFQSVPDSEPRSGALPNS